MKKETNLYFKPRTCTPVINSKAREKHVKMEEVYKEIERDKEGRDKGKWRHLLSQLKSHLILIYSQLGWKRK